MAGKFSLTSRLLCLSFCFLFFWGQSQADESKWVAVLQSDSESVYEVPIHAFTDAIGVKVRRFNLHGNIYNDDGLRKFLQSDPPAVIYALGAKAAYAAGLWTKKHPDIPVLFSMVINWQKYELLSKQENIAGISSEVNPGNQFISLSLFAPKVKKIGVIYSPEHSKEIVHQARKAAKILGFSLIEEHLYKSDDFRKVYRNLAHSVDAFWITQDPMLYTLENMGWLERRCVKDKLICIGQSRNLTQIGLMMSIKADITNIGVQAASMAKNIMDRGQHPSQIGVMDPLGIHIYLNKRTADKIGIQISAKALDIVTEMIE